MKITSITLILLTISSQIFPQVNQNSINRNLDQNLFENLINKDNHQNDFKQFIKENINKENVKVTIKNFSVNQIEYISEKLYFLDLQYNYKGSDWTAEAFRLIGIALGENGYKKTFYDSGIYMPACDWGFYRSVGNLKGMIINGWTLLVFHEKNRSVVCDPVSTKEKVSARFYNVSKSYQKICEIDTKYINYGESSMDSEPAKTQSVFYYENMCPDKCKAITFFSFTDNKLTNVETLTLDESGLKLIPY